MAPTSHGSHPTASSEINWAVLQDGRIYGYEPTEDTDANCPLTRDERITDHEVRERELLEEAKEAKDPQHRDWAHREALRERAAAARLAIRARRARRRPAPRVRVGHRTPGTRRRPGTSPRRRTTGNSSSTGDPPLDSEDDEGDRPPLLQQELEHRLQRVGPHGVERPSLVEQVAWLGHDPSKVNDALEALVVRGHLLAVVGDADVDVICWPEGPA